MLTAATKCCSDNANRNDIDTAVVRNDVHDFKIMKK